MKPPRFEPNSNQFWSLAGQHWPKLTDIRPQLIESGPFLVAKRRRLTSGKCRATSGRLRANVGRARAKARFLANLSQSLPTTVQLVGRCRAQASSKSANVGPNVGGRHRTQFHRCRAQFGRCLAKMWATLNGVGRDCPTFRHTWPEFANFTGFGQASAERKVRAGFKTPTPCGPRAHHCGPPLVDRTRPTPSDCLPTQSPRSHYRTRHTQILPLHTNGAWRKEYRTKPSMYRGGCAQPRRFKLSIRMPNNFSSRRQGCATRCMRPLYGQEHIHTDIIRTP